MPYSVAESTAIWWQDKAATFYRLARSFHMRGEDFNAKLAQEDARWCYDHVKGLMGLNQEP